jgi:putative glutamine amidotransferase
VQPVQPPRIGLTTYREHASWGVWSEPADLLPATYADAVQAAGGVAMLLPPGGHDPVAGAESALDGVHGVLLAGGADLDPGRYGASRGANTGTARPDRDTWELAVARAALDRGLPLLGVCRGMQVLNVALGGTLVQHLPEHVGSDAHSPTVGVHGRHRVRFADGSLLGKLLGTSADVATYHHQGVETLGAGLVPTAWADDGVVEAAELPGDAWVVAVQWHPEVHDRDPVFDAFVHACTAWRAAAAGNDAASPPESPLSGHSIGHIGGEATAWRSTASMTEQPGGRTTEAAS